MCLHRSLSSKIQITRTPKITYKILDAYGYSPFQGSKYTRGEIKKVGAFSDGNLRRYKTRENDIGYAVHEGLHVYTSLRKAKSVMRNSYSGRLLVQCTIPKGTPFIRGYDHQIVTLKLRVGKVLHSTGNLVAFAAEFNTNTIQKQRARIK